MSAAGSRAPSPPAENERRRTLVCTDPASGEILRTFPAADAADVDRAVSAAAAAQPGNRDATPERRARLLAAIGRQIEQEAERLAELECRDTGKPISQARTDVTAAARYFAFYAGAIETSYGDAIPLGPDVLDYTLHEPWGVCGQIIPWNYPLQVAARCVAPAVAAGNAVVLKPSEDAFLTAVELARIARESGAPEGLLEVVVGYGDAGAALVDHPDVRHITFVGSPETGGVVAEAAARRLAPVQLELGGKSPNVVFADADLDRAIPTIVRSLVQNAGQSCSAGSRLLVEEPAYEAVLERVAGALSSLTIGPGIDDPDLGPLVSRRQFDRATGMLERARGNVEVLAGGSRAEEPALEKGFYLQATLVAGADGASELWNEEVFGPVLVAAPFRDEEEAVETANSSPFGLVAGVWTRELSRAHRVARRIEAGQIFVNGYGVGGGVSLPFGGVKRSGYGRSKGLEGLRAYSQVKNVFVAL